MNKNKAKEAAALLVDRFGEQIDSYKSGHYNEAQTRLDFINPLFKALGWDVDNQAGYAEAYREVIYEDKIKIAGATKAPDYSFRLPGGKRLFFVEAKKPSVSVKDEIQPAYQVRRYGWSAKLPISIITDFEEFAVYDCSTKPSPSDKAANARINYLTFTEYINEFDFLWETFSKESVLKGSFDKFVVGESKKRGTSSVDKEFLTSLDNWRTVLAVNIAKNNPALNEFELNFAVQQTLDRIIFLRIAEDRRVEPYGTLQSAVKSGELYYKNLFALFRSADEKYNSGLFDFKLDKLSDKLVIENKTLKSIINELYYPVSPYEFSVLSVEILGSAYEQFLGKTIRISGAHRAKIEEKPEVRKAGGVYYTPQYIVDYIVKNTVGKLIEGKTPAEIEKIKIVDPACGSGSFLLGAYDYLLSYHREYYNSQPAAESKKDKPLTPDGFLTSAVKKRILINNIFGVDIDANAVEVTKLSLLLKCLEGETEASISTQLSLWHDRVLPTLDDNIKSGNSLIDTDFYDQQLDFGEIHKIKPFNWQKSFPSVFAQGGFDAVIGNPPYGALFDENQLSYFKKYFKGSVWRVESYLLFVERGLSLLRLSGLMGFIIPDTLASLSFTQPTRELLLQNSKLINLVCLPSNVFVGATVDTIIMLTEKTVFVPTFHPNTVNIKTFGKKDAIFSVVNPKKEFVIEVEEWYKDAVFNLHTDNCEKSLISKIETQKITINDIAQLLYGIKAYQTGKGKPPQTTKILIDKPFTSEFQVNSLWLPFYDGKHIGRYEILWKQNNWINYGIWLAEPRKPNVFEGDKILIRKITGKTLIATYISETSYCNTLLFVLKLTSFEYKYRSILSILNSSLIGWYFRKKFQINDDDTFPQIMIRDILQFPIPIIDATNSDQLEILVEQMIHLNQEKQRNKISGLIEEIQSKIDYCDDRINQIVYNLYNLTPDEIKLIESGVEI